MHLLVRAGLALLVLAGPIASAAEPKFKMLGLEQVDAKVKTSKGPVVFLDANDADFRKENGVVAGARLLSSFDRYDVAKELPAERGTPLVFYCSNRL